MPQDSSAFFQLQQLIFAFLAKLCFLFPCFGLCWLLSIITVDINKSNRSVILDSSTLFSTLPAHHWSYGSCNHSMLNSFVDV